MADTVGTESRHNIITHNNLEDASHCTNIVWKRLCVAVVAQEADTSIADSDGGGELHVKLHNKSIGTCLPRTQIKASSGARQTHKLCDILHRHAL